MDEGYAQYNPYLCTPLKAVFTLYEYESIQYSINVVILYKAYIVRAAQQRFSLVPGCGCV